MQYSRPGASRCSICRIFFKAAEQQTYSKSNEQRDQMHYLHLGGSHSSIRIFVKTAEGQNEPQNERTIQAGSDSRLGGFHSVFSSKQQRDRTNSQPVSVLASGWFSFLYLYICQSSRRIERKAAESENEQQKQTNSNRKERSISVGTCVRMIPLPQSVCSSKQQRDRFMTKGTNERTDQNAVPASR